MTTDSVLESAFVIGCAALVAGLLAPAAVLAQNALPLRVYVTTVTPAPLPILTAEQHGQEITLTKNQIFTTAERLRREHGGKIKTWPREAVEALDMAYDANTLAVARADYEHEDTRARLADSVADVVREIGKSKVLTLAASADQADLVLAVTGRRRTAKVATAMFDNNHFVRFQLAPGALADGARVLDAMRRHEWNGQTTKLIARPRSGADFADLEAGSPYGMRQAGAWAAGIAERFAREQFGPAKK